MATGGNSKANQHKNTLKKSGRGSRGRGFRTYANEDRRWHNKLARLERRARKTGMEKYRSDYESVMARSPIQVRNKYKAHRLAAE